MATRLGFAPMVAPSPASKPSPATSGVIPAEWPTQAADAIVDLVEKVRDKTTKPALTVARGFVYGLLALVVGTVALVLFLAGLIHLLEHLPGRIWTVYLGFAIVFLLGGSWAMRKANGPAPKP